MHKKKVWPFLKQVQKTGDGIKQMFYSAVSDLPVFAENNNKESLMKELMEENGVENTVEGIKPQEQEQPPQQNINVNGQVQKVDTGKNKKKKCAC